MADENTESSTTTTEPSTESTDGNKSTTINPLLDTTKICSPSPRLNTDPILPPVLPNGNPNVAIVKPMLLTGFTLNPSKLNPFSRSPLDPTKGPAKPDLTPKFLPLLQNGSKSEPAEKSLPSTSRSDFVFGQNIHDRVVASRGGASKSSNGRPASSEMLFSSAVKEPPPRPSSCKSLSESAREYEESRAVKRRYDEVEIKTGEEGEMNILQIGCKLFTFDKNGGGIWQERGRGLLRLNDQISEDGRTHSRLVFRTAGSLRVILNTKIWAEMTAQIASNKSVRFTAFDSSGEIKVFLVTGSPDDIKQLHRHLEKRLSKEVEYLKQKDGDATTTPTEEPSTKKLAADE